MKETNKPEKCKAISLRVSFEQHKEMKLAATIRGVTIKELIENALTFYARFNQYDEDYIETAIRIFKKKSNENDNNFKNGEWK